MGYNRTDPSCHVPAFFEVWAEYAKDGHEVCYRDCADTARAFMHRACRYQTGLNADVTQFSREPLTGGFFPAAFRFDSCRMPMNIAMDYSWFARDKAWQQDYARRFQISRNLLLTGSHISFLYTPVRMKRKFSV